jgi:arylsulfatase A-like enzyme
VFFRSLESLRFKNVLLAGALLLVATGWAAAEDRGQRPNIVFVMIDDLGWMDLACQGNPLVETPHIDRFAREGLRFTDAYAAAPVCSPTRAAVITGLAPARLQITNHIPDRADFTPADAVLQPAAMLNWLPAEHVTIAERLKQAGYSTGFFGKWHLAGRGKAGGAGDPVYYPENQGFDVNIGGCTLGGPPTFFDPYRIHNIPSRKEGEYLPDRMADEAMTFLEDNRDRPFVLMLWNYTVHWPMEAPGPLLEKYKSRTGPGLNDTRYGAMIEAMDLSFGRLMAKLDQLELRDNTLVVFTSDNGGFSGVADNRPLRAGKGYLYEGGIRVPLMVRWPGVIEPGRESAEPVISMDFAPTLLEVAGVAGRQRVASDGTSLVGLFQGEDHLRRDAIYFHYPNYAWHGDNRLGAAIRRGEYKLIRNYDDQSLELYNLADDLGEKTDLASQLPVLARSLNRQLGRWLKKTGAAMPRPTETRQE